MPDAEQYSHLYIALFQREQPGRYYWALANPASAHHVGAPTTTLYRIGASPYHGWTQRVVKLALLPPDEFAPICFVHLPTIAAPRAELHGFLCEQPAEQGSTPLLSSHAKDGRWTSAQWVVRVLHQLVDAELLELPTVLQDPAAFYRRVNALGLKAEAELALDMNGRQRRIPDKFRRVDDILIIPHNYAD